MQEEKEGSLGSWRRGCRAALDHTRAPPHRHIQAAAGERGGGRKGGKPGRGLLGRVGWRESLLSAQTGPFVQVYCVVKP